MTHNVYKGQGDSKVKRSNHGKRHALYVICLSGEFVVDPETGVVHTRRPLDREILSHYTLRVRAQSDVISVSGESSDVAVVFVQVVDVNDHAPEVTYPLPDSAIHLQQKSVVPGPCFN